jgi:nucleoside-diphosphate-sugar epimerase
LFRAPKSYGVTKNVLITGAYGRVGTAIIDHLADDDRYEFTYLDRTDHDEHETFVADVSDGVSAIRPAFEGQDVVVHLAAVPDTDADWPTVFENNVLGMYNALEAARDAEVEQFVFGSSNHAVGTYEAEHAPELYDPEFDLTVDHTVPHRPDSYYGASKAFGEDLGRFYAEDLEFPRRFYALRLCRVERGAYDHPHGIADLGVDQGRWEKGSDEYEEAVDRMRAMWQSRRDLAQLVERCLADDSVEFDVFYGVSDNERSWFDIEHARDVLGYDPRDSGDVTD